MRGIGKSNKMLITISIYDIIYSILYIWYIIRAMLFITNNYYKKENNK